MIVSFGASPSDTTISFRVTLASPSVYDCVCVIFVAIGALDVKKAVIVQISSLTGVPAGNGLLKDVVGPPETVPKASHLENVYPVFGLTVTAV